MDLLNQNFDIIVIGGGPAGSTAGYKLGQCGARVLLKREEIYTNRYSDLEQLRTHIEEWSARRILCQLV